LLTMCGGFFLEVRAAWVWKAAAMASFPEQTNAKVAIKVGRRQHPTPATTLATVVLIVLSSFVGSL
jgi:hypothetical protein